ncbi:MAG: thiamine phosphate synthase [Chloroflexota bacterium]
MYLSDQTLRIIDANLNRIGESLRLLEDVARLLLNDAILSKQLKAMRHELATRELSAKEQLLQARNSEGDIGMDIEVSQQTKERDLPAAIIANASRIQESLRVLEELSKIPGIDLDSDKFKRARFSLYDIEKALLSGVLRKEKKERISGLYAIIDTQYLENRRHDEVVNQMLEGGARIIQLRDKYMLKKELLPIARQLKELCTAYNALFIVNDYLDIALAVDADGLHIGQDDLPLKTARKLLPIGKIIGCSVENVSQAVAAEADGADYIAAGAIYPTQSRAKIETVGLDMIKAIKKSTSLPLVAIGGINLNNAEEVLAAGADSIAVISAIMQADSPKEATRQIIDKIGVCN